MKHRILSEGIVIYTNPDGVERRYEFKKHLMPSGGIQYELENNMVQGRTIEESPSFRIIEEK